MMCGKPLLTFAAFEVTARRTMSTGIDQRRPVSQADFTADELTQRRMRVMENMGAPAVALLQGEPAPPGFEAFRQSNEFYYLCGVEVPGAYLSIDAGTRQSTLYLLPRDDKQERSEGPMVCCHDAELLRRRTGVEEVRPVDSLPGDLKSLTLIYLPHSPCEGRMACRDTLRAMQMSIDADPMNARPSVEAHFLQRIRGACPGAEIRDLSPILDELRLVKSPAELAVMRRAGQLSALAIIEAMRTTAPGMMEYQLGAIADYVYMYHGAKGGSYRAIIAGGPNAWLTHYYRNDCPLRDGDLVLMDYAPDVANYTSDIGRMWPVDGTYAPWQRELYGFMVEYHKTILSRIRPGATPEDVMAEAAQRMAQVLAKWTFSKPVYETAARKTLEFKGHLSHPVGMAVHDVGSYFSRPLKPGTVFAVDPQMWVPEEKLYIRVEDTIAVTETGIENLTAAAPLELDDVENMMRQESRFPLYHSAT